MNAFFRLPVNVNVPGLVTINAASVRPLSNVSPGPEPDSLDHWIFGDSTSSLDGIAQGTGLTLVGDVAFERNYAIIDSGQAGLVSEFPDLAIQTICAVVKINPILSNGGKLIFGAMTATNGDGGSAAFFSGSVEEYFFATARGTSQNNQSQNWGTQKSPGDWVFIAVAEKLDASPRSYTAYVGGIGYSSLSAPANKTVSANDLAFGQAYYTSPSFANSTLSIAEGIIFDTYKTPVELAEIYERSRLRMLNREISL